nr:PREDICTED: uncharacterized protein LOC105268158 [Fopius arisanus]
MCAEGGSDEHEGLDPVLYKAIQDYVTLHAEDPPVNYNQVVNLMCGSLRTAKKRVTEKKSLKNEIEKALDDKKQGSIRPLSKKGSRKQKKSKKSKASILTSHESILSISSTSSRSNMEEKINHLGGTSDSHTQKKHQARRQSKVEEGSGDSEVRKFSRWIDGMTGIKDNSSHSSKFNQKDLTMGITNYSFCNQLGDFSVESQSRCSSLTKDIKTSTPRKKLQRKRHLSDDQYLLGQRSSSFLSSSFIVDSAWNNISPIALKKAKKDSCETVVSNSTDGKTKRGSVGETVQGKQPLSPKNLTQEEQNSCKVSAISAGSVDVNRNISQPALTSNVVNNGNKENSSLIQGL